MNTVAQRVYSEELTSNEFDRLSSFIYSEYGLKMPISKKLMMEGRLKRRLVSCNIDNFNEYIEYVFSLAGREHELIHMVDALTTNKTDFFREDHHFKFLIDIVCPKVSAAKKLSVWSAGCSSGEEPYSIALTLEKTRVNNFFEYEIFGTDLSSDILNKASMAIYPMNIHGLTVDLKNKYFLKSKNKEIPTIRLSKELRSKVTFRRLNFVKIPYPIEGFFDVVFFRNVMIYFDRETQYKVLMEICSKIHKGGFLFIGHSESISKLNLPLRQIQPTIFEKI